jgi:thioredoxin 1
MKLKTLVLAGVAVLIAASCGLAALADVNATSDAKFKEEVLDSSKPVLVDFYADWCGPCRRLSPIIDEVSKSYEGKVKFVKINIDNNKETAAKYNITGIPAIKIFKGGKIVTDRMGLLPKSELISEIDKAIK